MDQTSFIQLNKPSVSGTDLVTDDKFWKENPDKIDAKLLDHTNKIGDLTTLTTTSKTDLVSAINNNVSSLAERTSAIYAKHYVVGDGITDDTTALRNAISAVPTGGTLMINCPIYVTDTITINKRINVICVNGGVIIPSGHANTAVVIGDITGINRYADMVIDLTILGGASSRSYGLILQNISNSRINVVAMCGSLYGVGMQGMLVNDIKLIVSVNYSYPYSKVMPTTANVRLMWSNVAGGYIGGNNANNLNVVLEGGATGLLIDDHQSQGNNFIKGAIQGATKSFDITNTFSMTLRDLHVEASSQTPVLTNCESTKIAGAFNNASLSLVGCKSTTIENISCVNLTIDVNCRSTVIQSLTINGGAYTDNAIDTIISGSIGNVNTGIATVFQNNSAFSYNLNGVNQTAIVSGASTKINFSTVDFDNKTEFVSAANCFKPKAKGKYLLQAAVGFVGTVSPVNVTIQIYKNGVLFKSVSGNYISLVLNETAPNADFYQVYVIQNTGSNQDVSGNVAYTYFTGSWVGY